MRKTESQKIALCGVLSALSVVVLLVGTGAMALGVPLGHDALTVLVLLAALPSASNVSLLAERYGADNGRIARVILVTTVASFLTFSLAVKLVE